VGYFQKFKVLKTQWQQILLGIQFCAGRKIFAKASMHLQKIKNFFILDAITT